MICPFTYLSILTFCSSHFTLLPPVILNSLEGDTSLNAERRGEEGAGSGEQRVREMHRHHIGTF